MSLSIVQSWSLCIRIVLLIFFLGAGVPQILGKDQTSVVIHFSEITGGSGSSVPPSGPPIPPPVLN